MTTKLRTRLHYNKDPENLSCQSTRAATEVPERGKHDETSVCEARFNIVPHLSAESELGDSKNEIGRAPVSNEIACPG